MSIGYLEEGTPIKLEVDMIPPYLSLWGIIKAIDEQYLTVEIEGKYAQKEKRQVRCIIPKETKACIFETWILKGEGNQLLLQKPEEEGINVVQRRKYIRVATEIPVVCYLIGFNDEKINSRKFFPGVVKDISGGGVLINTPLSLPIGTVIVFELELDQSKLLLTAKVLRNTESYVDGTRELGCGFIGIDEADLQKIMSYCSKLQLQANKRR